MASLPTESPALAARRSSSIAVCLTSAVIAVYAGVLAARGHFLSDSLWRLHGFLFSVLIATWFVADRRARGRFAPSFDHGCFVLLVLPFYAPYHLVATRRWRGVAIGIGMIGLLILPLITQVLLAPDEAPMGGGRFNIFWFLSLLAPAIIMLAASIARRVWVLLLAAVVSLGATYWFCVLAVVEKWNIRLQLATTEVQRQWVYDNDGGNQAFTAVVSGPLEAILYTVVWGIVGWKLTEMYRAHRSDS